MSDDLGRYADYEPDGGGWGTVARVAGTIAMIVVLFGGAYWGVRKLADTVSDAITPSDETLVAPGLPVQVDIPIGASAGEIGSALAEAGVVSSSADFERAVRAQRATDRLQAGVYEMETGMEVDEVIALLVEGPAQADIFRITVIEGLRVDQTLASLARQTEYDEDAFAEALLDGSVTSDLLQDEAVSLTDWEGLLFPDTYEVTSDYTPAQILQVLATTTDRRVAGIDWTRLEDAGYTSYDGLVIASLIEREVRVDAERPLVASVIMNRLEDGMLLQIDATVVYAVGGGVEVLTADDLAIDSPYNTYLYSGLPPTPISGVRLASLVAAADWADTDFLFYVLTSEEGTHSFTNDYDEFLGFVDQARADGIIP
ncbi:MAG TPA: endolytic transglycosylase MltG [Acidimicrobiia bacterium]|nr:endolytic transglycosylase MltG [Acidimicrobiia bacterium]